MRTIITLSGHIGSGKSSVAKLLGESIGFDVINSGALQRDIAQQHGLTTLALNEHSLTDRRVDDEIDARLIAVGHSRDRVIVDSRLAWHFIEGGFNVFLTVADTIGAERVYHAMRDSESHGSLEDALLNNQQRCQMEDQRFFKLYGIHYLDLSNYHAVIDSSYLAPDAVCEQIVRAFETWRDAREAIG